MKTQIETPDGIHDKAGRATDTIISVLTSEKLMLMPNGIEDYNRIFRHIKAIIEAYSTMPVEPRQIAYSSADFNKWNEDIRKVEQEMFKMPDFFTCKKVAHDGLQHYAHDKDDDSPYNIDGINYCGRCHVAISTESKTDFHGSKQDPAITKGDSLDYDIQDDFDTKRGR